MKCTIYEVYQCVCTHVGGNWLVCEPSPPTHTIFQCQASRSQLIHWRWGIIYNKYLYKIFKKMLTSKYWVFSFGKRQVFVINSINLQVNTVHIRFQNGYVIL